MRKLALGILATSFPLVLCALGGPAALATEPVTEVSQMRFAAHSQEDRLAYELVKGLGLAEPASSELIDGLTDYTERFGGSAKDLIDRHRGVDEATELMNHFSVNHSDQFVGAGLSRPGEPGNYWFAFTSVPDAAIPVLLAALPVDTALWTGSATSAEDVDSAMRDLSAALFADGSVEDFTVEPDRFGTTISAKLSMVGTSSASAAAARAVETLDSQLESRGSERTFSVAFSEVEAAGTTPTSRSRWLRLRRLHDRFHWRKSWSEGGHSRGSLPRFRLVGRRTQRRDSTCV